MTEVIGKRTAIRLLLVLAMLGNRMVLAQAQAPATAADLYEQLRTTGLDAKQIYHIRDADLDVPGLHIALSDGVVVFTPKTFGRVTGAFFLGEGEILVVPSDRAEKESLNLFTGAAVLEERFSSAYLRFNDDTFEKLQPYLRPAEDEPDFAKRWDELAHNLAEGDALRLFAGFSNLLPAREPVTPIANLGGRYLHARLQGNRLGVFDLFFDEASVEPVSVGKMTERDGVNFYDIWLSFVPRAGRDPQNTLAESRSSDPAHISNYRIRADVTPPQSLHVDAVAKLDILASGTRTLMFELSRALKIERIEAGGAKVEFIHNPSLEGTQLARRGNDLVAVVLPNPMEKGQSVEMHFVYGGDVLSEAGSGLLWVGARGTWYPNFGLSNSTFDLQFRYPKEWTLLATGQTAPAEANAAGDADALMQVSRWVSERPIPVAGFNLGKYEKATARSGSVIIESYATTGLERSFPGASVPLAQVPGRGAPSAVVLFPPAVSPARNAQAVADSAAEAITAFSQEFGPFPFRTLAITQMPGQVSQGWPGLVFLSSYVFLTSEERGQLHLDAVTDLMHEQVTAHEVAHQWWGDLLLWRSYRDQWLFEALANYSALMLLEKRDPVAFHAVMERYRDNLLMENGDRVPLGEAGPVTLGMRLSSSRFPEGYLAISYGRGTWMFHMLRNLLRDAAALDKTRTSANKEEPFLRALRKMRDSMEGQVVTTRRMVQFMEEELPPAARFEGKKSLDWFLDGWINGEAVPGLRLKSVRITKKGNAATVAGIVVQKEAPHDLVTSVPLYAIVPGRSPVLIGRVFADGPESAFRLTTPAGTQKIVLDAYDTVLALPR